MGWVWPSGVAAGLFRESLMPKGCPAQIRTWACCPAPHQRHRCTWLSGRGGRILKSRPLAATDTTGHVEEGCAVECRFETSREDEAAARVVLVKGLGRRGQCWRTLCDHLAVQVPRMEGAILDTAGAAETMFQSVMGHRPHGEGGPRRWSPLGVFIPVVFCEFCSVTAKPVTLSSEPREYWEPCEVGPSPQGGLGAGGEEQRTKGLQQTSWKTQHKKREHRERRGASGLQGKARPSFPQGSWHLDFTAFLEFVL